MLDPVRSLRATVTGAGPRTLVLGNGFCTTRHSWDAVAAALPDGWRVVRYEYAGATASAAAWDPARHATLHGHADDVAALLAALDVRDAVFVGHSMSGMVGLLAHLAAPARIARVVLIGSSPRYIDDPATGYVGGLAADEVEASLARADADLSAWMAGFAPVMLGADAAPHLVREYAGQILHMRPDVARTMLRAIFRSDFRAIVPRVDCPVHVLQPADDAAAPPAVGAWLVRALPRGVLHPLPFRGHLPHLTHPERVAAILRAILAQASAGIDDRAPAPGAAAGG